MRKLQLQDCDLAGVLPTWIGRDSKGGADGAGWRGAVHEDRL